jgi:hypothetical protein
VKPLGIGATQHCAEHRGYVRGCPGCQLATRQYKAALLEHHRANESPTFRAFMKRRDLVDAIHALFACRCGQPRCTHLPPEKRRLLDEWFEHAWGVTPVHEMIGAARGAA